MPEIKALQSDKSKSLKSLNLQNILKKYSRREVDNINALYAFFSNHAPVDNFLKAIAEHLHELFNIQAGIEVRQIIQHSRDKFSPGDILYGELCRGYLTRCRYPILDDFVLIHIDYSFANWLLNTIVGSRSSRHCYAPSLSGLENGVITYALLSVLERLNQKGIRGACIPVEVYSPQELMNQFKRQDDSFIEILLAINLASSTYYSRVIFPVRWLRQFNYSTPAPLLSQTELTTFFGREIQLTWPVILGECLLAFQFFYRLECGDIIFPDIADKTSIIASSHGRIDANFIWPEDNPYRQIKINDWRVHTNPHSSKQAGLTMTTNYKSSHNEETVRLANFGDIRIDIVIGNMSTTVQDLARMSGGEILVLDTKIQDPVLLMVDQNIIGTGELVDVEGRLGVRVLKVGNSNPTY